MSKLNLANLAQDEMTKDEAQKVRAGQFCSCYCTCSCSCPPEKRVFVRIDDRMDARKFEFDWIEVSG